MREVSGRPDPSSLAIKAGRIQHAMKSTATCPVCLWPGAVRPHQNKGSKVQSKGNLGPAAEPKVPAVLSKAKEDVHPAKDNGPSADGPVQPRKKGIPQDLPLHVHDPSIPYQLADPAAWLWQDCSRGLSRRELRLQKHASHDHVGC